MKDSSQNYSKSEAIKMLFKDFAENVPDTLALFAMEGEDTVSIYTIEDDTEESVKAISTSIQGILDRLSRELVTGSGPVSFFDTDINRLIFIQIKDITFCVVLKLEGSVDVALPYAYLTAEKIGNIMENRPVELSIPLIKIITDEDEQKQLREHFFELRSSEGNFQFKIVVIGDENVGKTSLILRHAENKFKKDYLPTLGVSITSNSFELPLRKATVNFSVWDFGGQKYFRRVRLSYYAGSQACLIVFDLTNKESFENVLKWEEEKHKLAGDIITILVGNKNDLVNERVVSREEVTAFANEHGYTYFETSALTGANVRDVFNLLAYKLVDSEARKIEAMEIESMKDELLSLIEDNDGKMEFGLIRNKQYFAPLIQAFLDMDRNPEMVEQELYKEYLFSSGLRLVTMMISDKEYFFKQIELLKGLDGVLGVFNARQVESDDEYETFTRFLKLLFQNSTKKNFIGSIGIICDKDNYSDILNKLDISDVLKIDQNSEKAIFFYNLTDNYLLEISDNLKMLFTSLSLM